MAYEKIALNLRKREAKAQRALEERVKAAEREIETLLAQFLAIDPGLQQVILFGSLAKKTVRSINFDIDLAVRCSPDKFLRLVGAAFNSEFAVDVVDLDTVNQALRQFILSDGIVLYEKR